MFLGIDGGPLLACPSVTQTAAAAAAAVIIWLTACDDAIVQIRADARQWLIELRGHIVTGIA